MRKIATPYLITYDLNKHDKDYPALFEAIRQCSSYSTRPLKSVWFIKSSMTAKQISEKLHAAMDSNDDLAVVEISSNNYYGFLKNDNWDDIVKNILN